MEDDLGETDQVRVQGGQSGRICILRLGGARPCNDKAKLVGGKCGR